MEEYKGIKIIEIEKLAHYILGLFGPMSHLKLQKLYPLKIIW